jgi:hypothetical protein
MRNIKKSIKVCEVECTIYDRVAKEERTIKMNIAEIDKSPDLPENCILIERKTIAEKEVVYKMSPDVFVKYATPVTDDDKDKE